MSWRSASNLAWLRGLPGVREKEPLASRTSFGIGGPADFFLEPAKAEGIERVLTAAREKEIPYFLLGAGTPSFDGSRSSSNGRMTSSESAF